MNNARWKRLAERMTTTTTRATAAAAVRRAMTTTTIIKPNQNNSTLCAKSTPAHRDSKSLMKRRAISTDSIEEESAKSSTKNVCKREFQPREKSHFYTQHTAHEGSLPGEWPDNVAVSPFSLRKKKECTKFCTNSGSHQKCFPVERTMHHRTVETTHANLLSFTPLLDVFLTFFSIFYFQIFKMTGSILAFDFTKIKLNFVFEKRCLRITLHNCCFAACDQAKFFHFTTQYCTRLLD